MRARGTTLGLCLLMVVVAFAGCAQPAPAIKAGPTTAPTAIHSSGGTATLVGLVVDDEQMPVAGADVAVMNRQAGNETARLSSDSAGRFTVTGLPGGAYLVYARRLGYFDAAPKAFEIEEGETANLTITLKPLPRLVPSHTTKLTTHNYTNSVCLVVMGATTACGVQVYSGGGAPKPVEVDESVAGELQTFVMEMRWTPTVGVCPGYFRSDVYSPEQTGFSGSFPSTNRNFWADDNPWHWDNIPESYRSPTKLVIQREGDALAMLSPERTDLNDGTPIEISGKWHYTVDFYTDGAGAGTPVGLYCVIQQNVYAAATTFFIKPVPDLQWTAWG